MNPYRKAASFVIRMIAFGFILFGGLQLGAEFFARHQHKATTGNFWIAMEILALLLGFILLFKSGALAKKLTEDFEE